MVLDPIIERRNKDSVMGLGEHLEELRARLAWALVGLLPILIVSFVYGWTLVRWMLKPALDALAKQGLQEGLQVTSALESFSAYFYVVVLATLVVGGPWVVFQIWKFVAPGLYSKERRFAYVLAPMSLVLAVLGVGVMYFGMLPTALSFLVAFGSEQMRVTAPRGPVPQGVVLPVLPVLEADPEGPTAGQMWLNGPLRQMRIALPVAVPGAAAAAVVGEPTIEVFAVAVTKPSSLDVHLKLDQYVDLFVNMTLVFAVAFQLPVVMLLLGWSGLVTAGMLRKYRKHALAGSVIVGAVISPTGDPMSLLILQVPLYLLFEFGLLLMWALPASRIAGKRDEGDDDDTPPKAGPAAGGPGPMGGPGAEPLAGPVVAIERGGADPRSVPRGLGAPPREDEGGKASGPMV